MKRPFVMMIIRNQGHSWFEYHQRQTERESGSFQPIKPGYGLETCIGICATAMRPKN
jgi:hypothetical protein